jgi:glycosyltransferase involved in cell wall biosynthesis
MGRRITPARDLLALARLYRLFRRLRPEIVHAHTPKGGLLGTLAARLARVPICVYHIRGLPFMGAAGARRALLTCTERLACAMADRVLCVSHSIRDVAIAHRVCPAGKVGVLLNGSGNGVDALGRFDPDRSRDARAATRDAYRIPHDAVVLGFVGRIVRDKGIVELIEAWRSLRDEFPNLHLLLVGFFEPYDPLPPAVERAIHADPRIHLTGRQADTPSLYAAMDVVVLPTYREGLPNVPLEAASMRLPVVATDIPGCTDAIAHGRTGTLVPPRDAGALAKAIAAYVRRPEMRLAHGLAGREHMLAQFLRERIWEALRIEYVRLLEANHADRESRADHSMTHSWMRHG